MTLEQQSPESFSHLSHEEIGRYSRHLIMPEVGMDGQRKLKAARVLLVGVGGLGSPVAMYLAAAGIGQIGLVDYDTVDESNLQRQIIHGTKNTRQAKVDSARDTLLDINPHITITCHQCPLTSENTLEIIKQYDIIIDGTDNLPTRYLLNDACFLSGKPLVYGSVYRFEGQVSVFDARRGPCYRCLFPTPPPLDAVPTCAEAGVLGILPGTIGTIQATEAIKLILDLGNPLIGQLLIYDALNMSFDLVKLRKNPYCPVCGDTPSVTDLIDYEQFCDAPAHDHSTFQKEVEGDVPAISVQQVKSMLDAGRSFLLIDVRPSHEWAISDLDAATHHIPYTQVAEQLTGISPDQEIIVYCRIGKRSAEVVRMLRTHGYNHVRSMTGGINRWAEEIDPSLPRY